MRINHNLMAMNTHRQLGVANNQSAKSMQKLSSGLRINSAADDAAGLAISEKMRGQIRGLDQASSNAQDGISLVQTAEGALNETHDILQRMRELAVQSATDTNTADDRSKIQGEMDQLAKEITRISNTTEFNTQNLMAGGLDDTFHIGANKGQNVELKIGAMDAFTLGVAGTKFDATFTGTTKISSIALGRNTGTAIVDGATPTITAADITAAHATTGGVAAATGTVTVESTGNTTELNGYTIQFTDNTAAIQTTIDTTAKTIVVAADFDNGSTNAPANEAAVAANINTALTNNGFTAQISVALGGGAAVANIGTSNTANANAISGGSDGSLTQLTIGGSQTVDVKDTDTSVTISNGAYSGLTIDFAAGQTAGSYVGDTANVTISAEGSSAATITNGSVTDDATVGAGINVSTQSNANSAISTIDDAITKVSEERAKLGSVQNRLEHTINNLDTSSENLQAAESRIRDVDMAKEMMNYTKNNILAQAAQSMLAQANQAPQGVLQLLR